MGWGAPPFPIALPCPPLPSLQQAMQTPLQTFAKKKMGGGCSMRNLEPPPLQCDRGKGVVEGGRCCWLSKQKKPPAPFFPSLPPPSALRRHPLARLALQGEGEDKKGASVIDR